MSLRIRQSKGARQGEPEAPVKPRASLFTRRARSKLSSDRLGPFALDARDERVERGPELVAKDVALHQQFVLGAVDDDETAGAQAFGCFPPPGAAESLVEQRLARLDIGNSFATNRDHVRSFPARRAQARGRAQQVE